jgi:hypothetical protein
MNTMVLPEDGVKKFDFVRFKQDDKQVTRTVIGLNGEEILCDDYKIYSKSDIIGLKRWKTNNPFSSFEEDQSSNIVKTSE